MDISLHSHLESNRVIATKFCTWHDSYVQKFVTKFPSNLNCGQKIVSETGPRTTMDEFKKGCMSSTVENWNIQLFLHMERIPMMSVMHLSLQVTTVDVK